VSTPRQKVVARYENINSNDGCHIDQVMGQSLAFQVGLPRVIAEKEARSALRSLWTYSFRPTSGRFLRAKLVPSTDLRENAGIFRERDKRLKQESETKLFQSEKQASVGKLAGGVAHEINNPLTCVLTNSSLILSDLPPDDPRREDLQAIVDETLRCRKIVVPLMKASAPAWAHSGAVRRSMPPSTPM
jgi:signal transduction histidine kinase